MRSPLKPKLKPLPSCQRCSHNQQFAMITCRSQYQQNSHLPRMIKDWNALPMEANPTDTFGLSPFPHIITGKLNRVFVCLFFYVCSFEADHPSDRIINQVIVVTKMKKQQQQYRCMPVVLCDSAVPINNNNNGWLLYSANLPVKKT